MSDLDHLVPDQATFEVYCRNLERWSYKAPVIDAKAPQTALPAPIEEEPWQRVMRLAGERLAAAAVKAELVKAAAVESRRIPDLHHLATCDQGVFEAYCQRIEREQAVRWRQKLTAAMLRTFGLPPAPAAEQRLEVAVGSHGILTQVMPSDETGITDQAMMAPKGPAPPAPATGIKPAIHGICTTADGDHRLGRFRDAL